MVKIRAFGGDMAPYSATFSACCVPQVLSCSLLAVYHRFCHVQYLLCTTGSAMFSACCVPQVLSCSVLTVYHRFCHVQCGACLFVGKLLSCASLQFLLNMLYMLAHSTVHTPFSARFGVVFFLILKFYQKKIFWFSNVTRNVFYSQILPNVRDPQNCQLFFNLDIKLFLDDLAVFRCTPKWQIWTSVYVHLCDSLAVQCQLQFVAT
jgi:hypothetical protein